MRIAALSLVSALLPISAACSAPRDATPDAVAVSDARPSMGAFVSSTRMGPITAISATVPIPPTAEGDDLVVVIMRPHPAAHGFAKDVTGGGTFLDSWFWNRASGCPSTADVWLPWDGPVGAGTSSIVIDNYESDTFVVDVFELAGVAEPFESAPGGPQGMMPGSTWPLPAEPGDVVFSTITTCDAVTSLAPGSSFVPLDTGDVGTSAAYYIPTVAGSYGAAWATSGGDWGSSNLVLR